MNTHLQEHPVGGLASGFDSAAATPQRAQSTFPFGLNFFPFSERLLESLHLGVVFQDAKGHIGAANAAAEQILGLTLDQMRGLHSIDPLWNVVRADGSPFPGDQHPAMVALATHLPVLDVKMGIRDLGTAPTRWINIRAFPVLDANGLIALGVYAVFEDISLQMQWQASESASEHRFRALFETMSEGMALHALVEDADGRATDYLILDVNPAFESQTGVARASVVNKLATQAYGVQAAPFLESYAQVARTRQSVKFEQ